MAQFTDERCSVCGKPAVKWSILCPEHMERYGQDKLAYDTLFYDLGADVNKWVAQLRIMWADIWKWSEIAN